MKLIVINEKVHLASKTGALISGKKVDTAACNPKKAFYPSRGIVSSFDGDASQVTCQKCQTRLKGKNHVPQSH